MYGNPERKCWHSYCNKRTIYHAIPRSHNISITNRSNRQCKRRRGYNYQCLFPLRLPTDDVSQCRLVLLGLFKLQVRVLGMYELIGNGWERGYRIRSWRRHHRPAGIGSGFGRFDMLQSEHQGLLQSRTGELSNVRNRFSYNRRGNILCWQRSTYQVCSIIPSRSCDGRGCCRPSNEMSALLKHRDARWDDGAWIRSIKGQGAACFDDTMD